jgi:hypothetical protein
VYLRLTVTCHSGPIIIRASGLRAQDSFEQTHSNTTNTRPQASGTRSVRRDSGFVHIPIALKMPVAGFLSA